MKAKNYSRILTLDPSTAPEGTYFDSGTPDRAAENRYFPGWYNDMTPWGYRNQESHLRVAFDAAIGARVIEWKQMHLRYLLNTDPFCSDVRIRARLCTPTAACVQYHDIPDCTEARLGIVLRYCDAPAFDDAAVRLLVMDENFSEIWSIDAASPGLGHTFGAQFFDVDGEGRDEVLASYQLLLPEGAPLWLMEANKDIAGRPGARQIDFAIIGDFAGDAELDPTLFVCSGGIYVVDGRSGRTRAPHRSARASFRCPVGANSKCCPGQSQARKIFRPRSLHLGDLYRPPAFPIG